MKIVCINNGPMVGAIDKHVNLTLGKAYEAVENNDDNANNFVYNIINDLGKMGSYYYKRFEMIDEYRDKKISKLLENDNYLIQ